MGEKSMRIHFWIGILLTAITLLVTGLLYPRLPSNIPNHWNIHGYVDHYGPKWSLLVLNPGVMAGILALFALLPWLSPNRFEVDTFRSTYLYLMLVLIGVFAYIQAVLLWGALSGRVDTGWAVAGGMYLVLVLLGNVLGKVRRNFYLGIRTPWTIANERVWNATHRLAAKLFVFAGLAGLVLLGFRVRNWPVFLPLMVAVVIPVVYSLILYKVLEHRGSL